MKKSILKQVSQVLKGSIGKDAKVKLNKRKEERCVHRHTRKTHPNCFRRGSRFLLKNRQLWYIDEGLTLATLDIETSNLKANNGFMLSWAVKYRGGKIKSALITRAEIMEGTFDKRLVRELLDELQNIDIVITYYGTRFDLPFFRSRTLYWGYDFPAYGSIYHFDVYYRARALLCTHRKSLDAVTTFLGIEGKTHLRIGDWFKAAYGNEAMLKIILEHNLQDVIILEKLFDRLEYFSKWTRKSI